MQKGVLLYAVARPGHLYRIFPVFLFFSSLLGKPSEEPLLTVVYRPFPIDPYEKEAAKRQQQKPPVRPQRQQVRKRRGFVKLKKQRLRLEQLNKRVCLLKRRRQQMRQQRQGQIHRR